MSVWVPSTSSRTNVFPLNRQHKTFYTGFYEPHMTNDKVSLEEIDHFISKINAEYKLYMEPKNNEASCWCLAYLFLITLVLDIFLFFETRDLMELFTNRELIFLIWFLFFLIIKLCGHADCCLPQDNNDPLSELKEKCQDLVDKQNAILRGQNLKWHLPNEFPTCIELTKDMEKKNNHLEIPNQVPKTTENVIIFPLQRYKSINEGSVQVWRFSSDFFAPEMVTDGQISCQEVQEFLSEINTCLKTPFKKSQVNTFLWGTFVLFGLLYSFNHFQNPLRYFLIFILAVLIVGLYLNRKKRQEERRRNNFVRESCQKIVDKYNGALQNQGLKWHLPDQFPHWVELCKVSQNQDPNSQPIEFAFLPTNLEDDIEARNQDVDQNNHKKFQNNVYVPVPENSGN